MIRQYTVGVIPTARYISDLGNICSIPLTEVDAWNSDAENPLSLHPSLRLGCATSVRVVFVPQIANRDVLCGFPSLRSNCVTQNRMNTADRESSRCQPHNFKHRPCWQRPRKQTKARPTSPTPTMTSIWQKPRKAILTQEQLAQFQESQCHKDIISYIESLNASVIGVKLSDACPQSPVSSIIPWAGGRVGKTTPGNHCDFVSVGSSGRTRSGDTTCGQQGFTIRQPRIQDFLR